MPWEFDSSKTGAARVLLVTQRRARRALSQALQFEMEDVAAQIDAVDVLAPVRESFPPDLVLRASALMERISRGSSELLSRDRPPVASRYDLLVVVIGGIADLQYVWPMAGLFRHAPASACVVDEVWREGLASRSGELRLLRQFDHVFVGTAGSVEAIAGLTGRPCSYLPPTVDTLALCPFPDAPPRAIDVYSMGRRSPATHSALLELAGRRRWFYLYDTLTGCVMPDFREHRRHLRDLLIRSRFLLAYPGKVDAPQETRGQEEIGYRYFEGAAAGAVLVGQAPANPWFEKLFDWRDAVIDLPYGTADAGVLLRALDIDPQRERAIRRDNVIGSLRRHDHLHRWAEVLRQMGLPESSGMELRRRRLRELADSIAQANPEIPEGRATRIS